MDRKFSSDESSQGFTSSIVHQRNVTVHFENYAKPALLRFRQPAFFPRARDRPTIHLTSANRLMAIIKDRAMRSAFSMKLLPLSLSPFRVTTQPSTCNFFKLFN